MKISLGCPKPLQIQCTENPSSSSVLTELSSSRFEILLSRAKPRLQVSVESPVMRASVRRYSSRERFLGRSILVYSDVVKDTCTQNVQRLGQEASASGDGATRKQESCEMRRILQACLSYMS